MRLFDRFRKLRVVEYDSNWPLLYEKEREVLKEFFGENLTAIHHIGSTAVPDLPSKPTLDILAVVENLTQVAEKLADYRFLGEHDIKGRKFFIKKGGAVQLHVFQAGAPEIRSHLALRNYLIAHPEKRSLPQKQLLEEARAFTPRKRTSFPFPSQGNKICFLNNVIKNPHILVGDYTYYHDPHGSVDFEKNNVLYHFPMIGDLLIIGKFCQIGWGTEFIMNGAQHNFSGFSTYPFDIFWDSVHADYGWKGDTVIGNDVWFGYKCRIMPGVKIGDGAIIGTGALVTKDVAPYTVVGGVPAKVIRKRFDDDTITKLQEIAWWDWPIEKILERHAAITHADINSLHC